MQSKKYFKKKAKRAVRAERAKEAKRRKNNFFKFIPCCFCKTDCDCPPF